MKTLKTMILAAAAAVALVSAVAGHQVNDPEPKVVMAFDDPVPQPNCPTFPDPCNQE